MAQLYTGSYQNLIEAPVNVLSSGDNVLVAGVPNQSVRIFQIFLVCAASVNVTFKDGVGGNPFDGPMAFNSLVFDLVNKPWFTTSPGNPFVMNLDAGVQVSGRVYYTIG